MLLNQCFHFTKSFLPLRVEEDEHALAWRGSVGDV